MIDTHSHIYDEVFDADRPQVVAEAIASGVERVVLANVDSSTIAQLDATYEQFPHFCLSAMGLHPTSVKENYVAELEVVKRQLERKKYVAIGEIGLDLYWDKTYLVEQQRAFKEQMQWAVDMDLPVIIHIRKAFAEVFEILRAFGNRPPRGVFHCFSGGVQEALYVTRLGFMLGIGGVVTYKNSNLAEVIRCVGIDKILLETDAPYLSPVPFRGKRNEPKYMSHILTKTAEVMGLSDERVDEITTNSAKELLGIG